MSDMQDQLRAWAAVYGAEGAGGLSRPANSSTSGDAAADRIEAIVQRMESQGRWKEGRVLRAELFLPNASEAERLRRLARIGIAMSRTSYYAYLKSSLAFLEGALSTESRENTGLLRPDVI